MEATICPSCGAETVSAFRLCGACGTPVEGALAVEEIQRFATVVTSDLKGSTALGERLDPESLREVLTLYFDEMQAVFQSHGGTIEKIIGDAIVAVFGLPVRHDDDALRAVEAASETQRVLASLNDRLELAWGVRLVARTGVATGVVVFGQASLGQHVLTGNTMQTSSAMEQHSPPLEVLIAQSTYDLVRDSVTVTPADPVTPKGMRAPVPTYRLVSVVARPEAGQARADTAAAWLQLCPACGQENPEAFRQCGMCGSTLVAKAQFRESRKTVTIVFADPKPSMLNGERPSAEALRDVMSRYFEAMKSALEQHGGTVEKFIGDAVMAVFGLPVRHEDDAVRAVRAALDMQAALPALNEDFARAWGVRLMNHIGVNTGEVIAGDASLGQRLVTGDAVNVAARLEQAAGPAEVIIGELTYRLAKHQAEVEAIPPLTLKGKAEPVPAYRLLAVRDRSVETTETAPFVGREVEMARLSEALTDAEGRRVSRLLAVVGDAGVGKSRLIKEFADRASEGARVVRGRCLPYGDGITFWPLAEVVREAAAIAGDDTLEVAIGKLGALLEREGSDPSERQAVVDRVAAVIGLSSAQFPVAELFWGARKLLEALARVRPLVVLVDDIHSAEQTFLNLLDHLVEAIREAPVLLLCSARHELLEGHAEWSESHAGELIVLEPLSDADSGLIIEQLLGQAGLDPTVVGRITAAAEGNPLFVEQMVSMLIDTGVLRREGETWVASAASEISVPPTIHALLAARFDSLGVAEKAVLEPASVIGLSFPVPAMVALVDETARPSIPTILTSLDRKQFVKPTTLDEDEAFKFAHLLVRDTAYGSLLKRARASYHERFVDWAERVNAERGRAQEFEEILGYHLEQAYRYRSELGVVDEAAREAGRRGASKLSSAGRRAFLRGDAPAAASLLRRARNLLPVGGRESIELGSELAEAQIELGQFDEAVATLDLTSQAAEDSESSDLAARADLVRLQLTFYTTGSAGEADNAVARVRAAIDILEAKDDRAGLARAWRLLAAIYATAGHYDKASDADLRLIDFARDIGEQRLAARGAVGYAFTILHNATPVAAALAKCEELIPEVRADRKAEADILGVVAQLHAMEGRFEQARELYRMGRELVSDLGPSVTGASASLEVSRVEMLAGDPAAAERELRRDYDTLTAMGESYYRSSVAAFLAHAVFALGRHPEALELSRVAEGLADQDDVLSQVAWRTARAKALSVDGGTKEAISLASEAVRIAAASADIEQHADALMDLAEVVGRSGDAGTREIHVREALALYRRKGDLVQAALAEDLLVRTPAVGTT
ncbi:MAG: adenylate/guanylate cyclase domain-containing protein [Candidatus Limnocylindrales bacterium]|nr:adenylate/guanylate cyclase domain-containing protein [Candidatus Limnocylindrales bacterium]